MSSRSCFSLVATVLHSIAGPHHALLSSTPCGHNALRLVGSGVSRNTELHVIPSLQVGKGDACQLRAMEEEVPRSLAGPDESPGVVTLAMQLLYLAVATSRLRICSIADRTDIGNVD